MLIKVLILKYGVKDIQGDIYKRGQVDFKKYLEENPLITQDFDMSKIPIGRTIKIEEDNVGLYATMEIDFEIRPSLLKKSNNEYEIFDLSLISKNKDIY